jgi:hypothetical protein
MIPKMMRAVPMAKNTDRRHHVDEVLPLDVVGKNPIGMIRIPSRISKKSISYSLLRLYGESLVWPRALIKNDSFYKTLLRGEG